MCSDGGSGHTHTHIHTHTHTHTHITPTLTPTRGSSARWPRPGSSTATTSRVPVLLLGYSIYSQTLIKGNTVPVCLHYYSMVL